MNKLLLFLLVITFLSGCVNQYSTPSPNLTPPENITPTENVTSNTTPPPITPPPETPPPQLTIKEFTLMIDHSAGYSFTPNDGVSNRIKVNLGDIVKISATSLQPSHNHGLAVDAFGLNVAVVTPQTIQFTADQIGTFQIYCKTCLSGPLGAHPWMIGTLVVQ